MADGVFGEFGNAVQIKFGHDVATVNFNRAGGDIEYAGDFRRGAAFSQQFQDFAFAAAELLALRLFRYFSAAHGVDDDG